MICPFASSDTPRVTTDTIVAFFSGESSKHSLHQSSGPWWQKMVPSRRRDCHLMAPPCTFIRCFNRDKQGVHQHASLADG